MTSLQGQSALDLVTQVQDHLDGVCSMFFNFAGALQRDASPVQVADDPVLEAPGHRPKHDLKEMATQLAQASEQLDELIEQLPHIGRTEMEQLQTLSHLKDGSDRQGICLREAVHRAEDRLALLLELFKILADNHLRLQS